MKKTLIAATVMATMQHSQAAVETEYCPEQSREEYASNKKRNGRERKARTAKQRKRKAFQRRQR